jgi:hypothetical protein
LLSRWYSICDHILQCLFVARLQLYLQELHSLVFGVLEKLQVTSFVFGVQCEAANETICIICYIDLRGAGFHNVIQNFEHKLWEICEFSMKTLLFLQDFILIFIKNNVVEEENVVITWDLELNVQGIAFMTL